jgi:hypothetical protein
VLVDLVLNHASSQHPYFKEALRDPASPHRSWFRFAPLPSAERGPWGQQVWHKSPERDEYYYGIFTSEMPDLNYATPAVRAEAERSAGSGSPRWAWTASGSTRCRIWSRRMALSPTRPARTPCSATSAPRCGAPCPARSRSARCGTASARAAVLSRSARRVLRVRAVRRAPRRGSHLDLAAPAGCVHAHAAGDARQSLESVQRNHDQTRTVSALGGDLRAARLSAELLLTLPGLPFVYYGEELGMTGDKPDPRLRTPMHWTAGRAAGFTTGAAWEPLQPDSATANVPFRAPIPARC